MTTGKAIGISAVAGLLLIAAGWFAVHRKSTASPAPAQAAAPAPPNAAHEKATLEEQLKKNPGHTPVLLRLAQLATEQSQPAEARKHLDAILKAEPGNTEALLELGRACYELNDVGCATSATEKILAVDPDHADALYNLGAIYANIGQTQKARQYWERAAQKAASTESGKKAAAALKQLGG